MKPVDPFPKAEKLQMEKELLGFYISGHPLDEYEDMIAASVRTDLSDPSTIQLGKPCSLIAMVASVRQVVTKEKKEKMGIYTLQTKEGDTDAVAFPAVYAELRDRVQEDQIYGFEGSFSKKDADAKLSFRIDRVCRPEELKPESVNAVHIQLGSEGFSDNEAKDLARTLKDNEGYTTVFITMKSHPDEQLQTGPSCFVSYSQKLLQTLKSMDIVDKVWVS